MRSSWPEILTFLCVAGRASPWAPGVSATASASDPPRSPPGAARARSGCRWWSGCTGSWRAPSGRPRRTKRPRDWCSSGRWDAGPSDSLCSQSGEEEAVRRRGDREEGATATGPGSARASASPRQRPGSHNTSQSGSALGRNHETRLAERRHRAARDALCLLGSARLFCPLFKTLHGPQEETRRQERRGSAERRHGRALTQRLAPNTRTKTYRTGRFNVHANTFLRACVCVCVEGGWNRKNKRRSGGAAEPRHGCGSAARRPGGGGSGRISPSRSVTKYRHFHQR